MKLPTASRLGQYSFLRRPASVESPVDCTARRPEYFTGFSHRHCLAKNSHQPIRAFISLLLLTGFPPTVLFAVAKIIVDSAKTTTLRTGAHVGKEILKGFPPRVVTYTSTAVIYGIVAMGSSAASPKFHPSSPFRGVSHTVLGDCLSLFFCDESPIHTATRRALPPADVISYHYSDNPTHAPKKAFEVTPADPRQLLPINLHPTPLSPRNNTMVEIIHG